MTLQPPAQVLCFGEALLDRLGPPGGEPCIDGPFDDRLGGAPANVACALARLGTPSALISRLGNDSIGAAYGHVLQERGVDTSALQHDPRHPSRIVLVKRDAGGDRCFGGFAGDLGEGFADQAIDAGALALPLAALLPHAAWFLAGTIPLASRASAEALEAALAAAAMQGVPLALDVNWRPTFWSSTPQQALERIQPLLQRAALLKLSVEEADWIGVGRDPQRISDSLPQRPAVLVTDGPGRLGWWLGGVGGVMESFPVPVVDTTGAGDAFLAGLLHRLCAEPSLNAAASAERAGAAVRFAAACGALVCQAAGAIDPQPDEAAVGRFLERARPIG